FDPTKDRIVFYGHQIVSKRMASRWMQRMKVTGAGVDPEKVKTIVYHHMFETKSYFTDKAVRRFIQKVGPDLIFKLLDLRLADNRGGKHPRSIQGVLKMRARVQEILAQKPPFGPKDLALNGHDLMALGVPEGPPLGKILKQLVEMVLDDPKLNTKEQLTAIVKEMR
ncbi:MAG: polynucleotide adenylyltransferase, partial [Deltaproteobacteria bacterium]|nr:polynucleotide adenylyltransferase [Deltaproteobacteria bacterium]